jgi:hypothetical protein
MAGLVCRVTSEDAVLSALLASSLALGRPFAVALHCLCLRPGSRLLARGGASLSLSVAVAVARSVVDAWRETVHRARLGVGCRVRLVLRLPVPSPAHPALRSAAPWAAPRGTRGARLLASGLTALGLRGQAAAALPPVTPSPRRAGGRRSQRGTEAATTQARQCPPHARGRRSRAPPPSTASGSPPLHRRAAARRPSLGPSSPSSSGIAEVVSARTGADSLLPKWLCCGFAVTSGRALEWLKRTRCCVRGDRSVGRQWTWAVSGDRVPCSMRKS